MGNQCAHCNIQEKCLKNGSFAHADTFVEEVFFRKCQENSAYEKLYFEWIDSKCIYIRYTNLSRADYGNFSKHDYSHSVSILNAITSVLGRDMIEQLGVTNLWLLLHCAYGHDIGMPYSFNQMQSFWNGIQAENEFAGFFKECLVSDDNDRREAAEYINGIYEMLHLFEANKGVEVSKTYGTDWPAKVYRYSAYLTSEYVRKNHAANSQKMMESCELFNRSGCAQVEPRFYKILGTCYMLHTQHEEEVCKLLVQQEWDGVTDNCHPRFVAFLLRMGDLLDIDNNRFDAIDLAHYGDIPEMSKLNKKKHESIVHIKYAKGTIEITSRSDDDRVCKLASEWFAYLKREVQYLSLHWTEIAPEYIGGCTLSEPKIEVFLGEESFKGIEDKYFKVDKTTLMDLVIGRNLYRSSFDFLREYLQNAMDASKMRFWLDFRNGDLDAYLLDENKRRENERKQIQPFHFKEEAFDRYPIRIEYDYIPVKSDRSLKEDVMRIEITDRGIGIDKECVDAISNIGTGWKRRKKYARELDSMPDWLKPTGGFGIGMQSGFMITDKVRIETKCEDDIKGREIILYSQEKNGRIEIRDRKVRQQGTKIIIDIPYTWFMNGENYKSYKKLNLKRKGTDFMNPYLVATKAADFLYDYVQMIMGNPLFPIGIKQKNCIWKDRVGFISQCIAAEGKDKDRIFLWEGSEYYVFEISNDVCIVWDIKEGIVCKRDIFKEENGEEWYYKGVKVWTEEDTTKDKSQSCDSLCPYIGKFTFDIWGKEVKECLTVDRNQFKKDFDYRSIANKYAIIYLNYLSEKHKLIPEKPNEKSLLRCLLAYKYVNKDELRNEIRERLMASQTKNEDGEETRPSVDRFDLNVGAQKYVDGVKEGELEPISIYAFLEKLWNEERVMWYTEKGHENAEELRETSDYIFDFSSELATRINPISTRIKMLLKNFFEKGDNYYKLGNQFIYLHDKVQKSDTPIEEKEKVFRKQTVEGRDIYQTNTFYQELCVSKIPFDTKFISEEDVIISPEAGMLSNGDWIVKNLVGREDPESEYIKAMTEDVTFDLLVNWVYDYQINPKRYTKDEIRSVYIELLKYLYEINVKPIVQKGKPLSY